MNFYRLSDYLFAALQYILPHHLLSLLMLALTRWKNRVFLNQFTPWFIEHYKVDMTIAKNEDWRSYTSFNDFFTRAIKPQYRPICTEENIASPVDACVSQATNIDNGVIIQAKNHHYSVQTLLGNYADDAQQFNNGHFSTLYLSPKDYHRIHMPVDGKLIKVIHVPGRLFSVNPATARTIPRLFARNERVVCLFETELGSMAVVMVGAIFVASIETVWQGVITPPTRFAVRSWNYNEQQICFKRGDEIARFNMGSTVILLFGENKISWNDDLTAEKNIIMGESIGKIN
ncbi:Phosphatidylserine decarboxylase [hydrothermal vent metagenome]|uniref:phosphatidylserine decarboxylase n=1 Tax=hydrothermal vent metagenome TaxID=652676 RepID=A0A3B1B1G5_9ZZZZ